MKEFKLIAKVTAVGLFIIGALGFAIGIAMNLIV
jgi:preprotein translocase subunit Sss1